MASQALPLYRENDDLLQSVTRLSRLVETMQSIAAQRDLELLLQEIADAAVRLMEVEYSGLLVYSEDKSRFDFFKISGINQQVESRLTEACVHNFDAALLHRKNVCTQLAAYGIPLNQATVGPWLSVPLCYNEQVMGAIFVGNPPGAPDFGANDEALLLAFANQAAIAIEHKRLCATAKELACVQERQRIAQALHDTLAQMFFTVGMEADWCLNHLSLDNEGRKRLRRIRRLAGRGSDEVRSAIFALRSRYLPGTAGLVDLLQDQVDEFKAQSGVAATLLVPSPCPPLPPLVSEAIYRIVRDSLANVAKHAHASAVMVTLYREANAITVTIQDDGIGLAEPLPQTISDNGLHFGVATMHQVATQAKGELWITNNDDLGVIVKARFPVSEGCCL